MTNKTKSLYYFLKMLHEQSNKKLIRKPHKTLFSYFEFFSESLIESPT